MHQRSTRDTPPYRFQLRVYWEDTDAGGVVFYANYLKFFERARTEWLRSLGHQQEAMRAATGVVFIVTDTTVRYLRPARLGARQRDRRVVAARGAELGLAGRYALAGAIDEREVLAGRGTIARRGEAGRQGLLELRLGLHVLAVVVGPHAAEQRLLGRAFGHVHQAR
jgi:tol-pal system-associated acyl-CoA thioesterase